MLLPPTTLIVFVAYKADKREIKAKIVLSFICETLSGRYIKRGSHKNR